MQPAVIKRLAFTVLGSPPVLARRVRAIARAGHVTILNLHRVGPDDGSAYRPLDPALFDELLGWLKQRFVLTTFAEIAEPVGKPRLVLSFDDGYRDFVEVTMPILARHGIRVNHNVIPGCVDSGLPPLNILAADFIGRAPEGLVGRLEVPGFGTTGGPRLWERLDEFIKRRAHDEQRRLHDVLMPQFRAWDGFRPTPMMSADDVRAAAAAGHEIGGHSYAHASMAHETDEYLRDDVQRCRAWLRDVLGQEMHVYAFPNGSFRRGQEALVEEAGVDHVLLVQGDFDDGRSPHRRLGVEATARSEARFKALGGLRPVTP